MSVVGSLRLIPLFYLGLLFVIIFRPTLVIMSRPTSVVILRPTFLFNVRPRFIVILMPEIVVAWRLTFPDISNLTFVIV